MPSSVSFSLHGTSGIAVLVPPTIPLSQLHSEVISSCGKGFAWFAALSFLDDLQKKHRRGAIHGPRATILGGEDLVKSEVIVIVVKYMMNFNLRV